MAKTRRARIDAENGHRRVTRPRLRITAKGTRGIPMSYLRASSGTVQHGPESREVGYDEEKPLCGLWIKSFVKAVFLNAVGCGFIQSVRFLWGDRASLKGAVDNAPGC